MAQGPDIPPVTIIVPVYRDPEITRNCLLSLASCGLPGNARVLVIDDHSPEAEVKQLCVDICREQGFELLVNEHNLGFVGTANRGLAHAGQADAILLNSDTVVSGDWVQRLQAQAYSQAQIATVTPFSNDGTICSYPIFAESNALPNGWTASELDQLFASANAGMNHPIPTAVGFCMYIKRACLEQVGLFDEENFGHGYGEECDFSLRASSQGWEHRIAADVFVYHVGSASFAGEAEQRKMAAHEIMDELHPEYERLIEAFVQENPLYELRQRVDQARMSQRPQDQQQVLNEHHQYSESILARTQHLIDERQQLQAMLSECREQFAATDAALSNADEVVARQQQELRELDAYARSLVEHIEKIEQSRSWRYTAFMRRAE